MTETSPYDLATEAAAELGRLTGVERHDVALVLGSGWLPAVDALGEATAEIATTDLPGFSAAAVAGHSGKIRSVRAGTTSNLLVFLSRTHYYEGKGVAAVVHGVRTAAKAGCRAIVLTNGCGGLKETWTPGHAGADQRPHQPHRPLPHRGRELRRPHRPLLAAGCGRCAARSSPSLDEGVYVQFPGPHYETPAEIAMVRAIGGHLVGMSTTLEAIAAREAGMEVLGISLVTNLAAGISGEPLNHEEVLEAGRAAASRMGGLLGRIVPEDLRSPMTGNADETRHRLIEAATRGFAEQGVHSASLLEITRQAGQRNRGAVHYHFGSREGMLVAVLEQHVELLAARERELLAIARQQPDDDLASAVAAFVRPAVELGDLGWEGRCYLVILAELVEDDRDSLGSRRGRGARAPGGWVRRLRTARGADAADVRRAPPRAAVTGHQASSCAPPPTGPGPATGRTRAGTSWRPSSSSRNLIAMVVGMLTAPIDS